MKTNLSLSCPEDLGAVFFSRKLCNAVGGHNMRDQSNLLQYSMNLGIL